MRNPYLRQFDKNLFKSDNFSTYAETKFFRPDQVQECLGTEYPDRRWDIDENRLAVFS